MRILRYAQLACPECRSPVFCPVVRFSKNTNFWNLLKKRNFLEQNFSGQKVLRPLREYYTILWFKLYIIGDGSFGVVRRGEWSTSTGRILPVAAKVLKKETLNQPGAFEDFVKEVQSMHALGMI